jgi:VIT1/CCC1 family predicted Fe2+/Mn2+ transporter/rubrerythrin
MARGENPPIGRCMTPALLVSPVNDIDSTTAMLKAVDNSGLLATLEANWQTEMEDCATYQALAVAELNPRRRNAMRGLAATEKYHADLWATRIGSLGGPKPIYNGKALGRAESFTGIAGGIDLVLRRLKVDERREIGRYKEQISDLPDEPSQAILREVIADENEHYKILSNLIGARPALPIMEKTQAKQALADLLAARRKRHPEAAGWVNDAIYAAHDGLGSIFGIVSGVAGATFGRSHFVLVAGLAGMVGSALSTGTGAYLTAKSERELFEAELARERQAVDYDQAEAREVLALNFQVRGLPEDVAGRLAHLLAEDKEGFIKALARTRGNGSEESLSNPWVSAFAGFGATAIGAFIPIIPFFFMAGIPAMIVAAIISLVAHFGIGAARSLMTIRSWWSSGLELTAFGAVEGIVTYSIGMALGHLVGTN